MPDAPEPAPADDFVIRRAIAARDFIDALFPGAGWALVVDDDHRTAVYTNLPPDELAELILEAAESHPEDRTIDLPVGRERSS